LPRAGFFVSRAEQFPAEHARFLVEIEPLRAKVAVPTPAPAAENTVPLLKTAAA
jgi:hypothetical protein